MTDTPAQPDTTENASKDSISAAAAKKCAIRDDTRSDSDLCRRQRQGGYGGGSRSTGSAKWN